MATADDNSTDLNRARDMLKEIRRQKRTMCRNGFSPTHLLVGREQSRLLVVYEEHLEDTLGYVGHISPMALRVHGLIVMYDESIDTCIVCGDTKPVDRILTAVQDCLTSLRG